jgi:ATP-dependent exoDNAse (exonuclease V) beta subunit
LPHISFSELKTWKECPYKRKLAYQDRIRPFTSNEFTIFGTSMHKTCEKLLLKVIKEEECCDYFEANFSYAIEEAKKQTSLDEKLVSDMVIQGKDILKDLLSSIQAYMGDYEIISSEEDLMELIKDDCNFKGFIDLVLKTPDGKYHIIDFKTCGWGWKMEKKTDPMVTYQLTYYKEFFAQKHKIPLENIETHFCLLKRTAKKDRVEIFRVSSGKKKIENANNLLTKAIDSIKKNKHIKNRLSCQGCEFYKTIHCT